MNRRCTLHVRAQIGNGSIIKVCGREAWALLELLKSGERGCTPIQHPGPRWSGYVHDLRKLGFVVETIREPHGGPFPGGHARYVLRSRVTILENAGAAA